MHSPPKRHFSDDTGKTDEKNKEDIRDQKGSAAEFSYSVWEQPDIRHSDGASYTGNDKSPFILKLVIGVGLVYTFHN